jgi:hypothetical protein
MTASCLSWFTPGERPPSTHWGPRTGLDIVMKKKFLPILGIESRFVGGLASSQISTSTELSRLFETIDFHPNSQLSFSIMPLKVLCAESDFFGA